VSKVKQLINSYKTFIAVPWKEDAAAQQRVLFCVYPENEELKLRAKIDEFEIVTREAKHDWALYDLTNTFAEWLTSQRYAKSYYQKPHLLQTLLPKYREYLVNKFKEFIDSNEIGENTVVTLKGVGSLFGFLKVKDVVENFAPLVNGRLLVLFPGSYENNNYRLLDGYDGWNYLAIPITTDK